VKKMLWCVNMSVGVCIYRCACVCVSACTCVHACAVQEGARLCSWVLYARCMNPEWQRRLQAISRQTRVDALEQHSADPQTYGAITGCRTLRR